MRYAMVKSGGAIVNILEASGQNVAANTPADCTAVACPDTTITPDRYTYTGGAFRAVAAAALTAADVEADLIAQVKATNEALVRGVYSTQYGKQKKYARKQQEVLDFRGLGTTLILQLNAFLALPAAAQLKKFRFSMAEAKLRGMTVGAVIDGYDATIEAIEGQVSNWEAIEQKAVADIKAAGTIAAKQAVFAAINWNWKMT